MARPRLGPGHESRRHGSLVAPAPVSAMSTIQSSFAWPWRGPCRSHMSQPLSSGGAESGGRWVTKEARLACGVPSRSIPSKGEVEQMEGIHQTCTHQTLVGTLPCPRLGHGLVVTCHQEGCRHWHLLYQEVSLRRPWGGAGWYRLPQGGRPKCRRTQWQGGRGFCPVPCSGWSSTEHRMVPIPLGKEGGDCKGHVVEGQETRGQGHLIYRCQAGLSLGGAGAASPWTAISPRVHRTLPG